MGDKRTSIRIAILKVLAALICLYFFVCSLDLLATSFRLLSGRNGGKLFSQSELLQNPIVGMMIGVLCTVLVQSSSTTTSIIVGMVSSDIIKVPNAIPMIMGANIGTSVTNTIVSFTQITDRQGFERAFSCAVLHDMFNWVTVIIFLTIEIMTGYLYHMTKAMVESFHLSTQEKPPDLLKAITKPLTKVVIQIDKNVLKGWTTNSSKYFDVHTLMKKNCERNVSNISSPITAGAAVGYVKEKYECDYLFAGWGIDDVWIGIILLILSLGILTGCLLLLVKILNSLMKNQMAAIVQKVMNADIPKVPWLTGYLAIVVGAIITILVQSSSVFTSTLTPLVGAGLIELKRAYPLTLGSNIGTTTTGILASLAVDNVENSLQIALCHLFFNISGIILFYPIPFMRWPLPMAETMGRTVAKYRWFAVFYLIFMFLVFPLYVFGLSVALDPTIAIIIGFVLPVVILIVIILINVLQDKKPQFLPPFLRNWDFLPKPLRSLDPYDKIVSSMNCCKKKVKPIDDDTELNASAPNGSNNIPMGDTNI